MECGTNKDRVNARSTLNGLVEHSDKLVATVVATCSE